MSDISMRRRWFGRILFGSAAIALPLTASVSYAQSEVAEAELPASVVAPAQPAEAAEPADKKVRVVKIVRDGEDVDIDTDLGAEEGEAKRRNVVRIRRPGDADGDVQVFEWSNDMPLSADQQKKLDEMMVRFKDRDFARLAERGERLALRGEEMAKRGEEMARRHEEFAARFADIQKNMPLIETNCDKDEGQGSRSWTDENGRKRVVICQRNIVARAAMGLRQARNAIANNREMSPEVRDEVLRELDSEIVRIEREG